MNEPSEPAPAPPSASAPAAAGAAARAPSAAGPPAHAGRALAWTLLTWSLAVVALVTLAPFDFRSAPAFALGWRTSGGFELMVNCCLLVVPGFLFRAAAARPGRDLYCVVPLVVAIGVATAVEFAQSAIPGRVPSGIDVAANAGGAWVGAMTHDALRRNLDLRLADRLLLELPLMGLVYLLVPLLWLAGEAAAEDGRRLLLTLPLGAMGGFVLASVWRHRLREAGALTPTRIALVAGAWFVVAAAPALRHRPAWLAAELVLVVVLTRWAATSPRFLRADRRRFEVATLRRVGPLYLLYLVVLAGWPWRAEFGAWTGALVPAEIGSPPRLGPLYRLVEYFAAFTLGGYLLAEARGRREEGTGTAVLSAVVPFASFAAALELLRGYVPSYGASLLRPALAAAAALLGAVIYRRQLAAVRLWLALRGAGGTATPPPGDGARAAPPAG